MLTKRTDPRYQEIRDCHYVPNRGTHGQQLHYLILLEGAVVGIISGASAVYGCAPRDKFFELSTDQTTKQAQLNGIINNTVFRLEVSLPNLATQVLALWRRTVTRDWEYLYQVPVGGFETFVVAEDWRPGTLYLADNWTELGLTQGTTKYHAGMETAPNRIDSVPKLIFCARLRGAVLPEAYWATWNNPVASQEQANRRRILFENSSRR